MFSQQQFSAAGSTGQRKHPREEPLEVQRENRIISTNSPITVNATETSGVNSCGRGSEYPNGNGNGGAAEGVMPMKMLMWKAE